MNGKILKQLREEKNMTQAELAKQLHTIQQTLGRWETNVTKPNSEMIKKIAEYFNVSIDYLYGATEQKNYKQDSNDLDNFLNRKSLTYNGENISKQDQRIIQSLIDSYMRESQNKDD